MSLSRELQSFFKSEIRNRGEAEFSKGLVRISLASDNHLQAYVDRKSKVTLSSTDISSPILRANCNCSTAKKAQFCRHIWAVLLAAEAQSLDILTEKISLHITEAGVSPKNLTLKEKQKEYRREQYQKAKDRNKDRRENLKVLKQEQRRKQSDRDSIQEIEHPQQIKAALRYFANNGFVLHKDLNEPALRQAWIKLSRIFHPDRGGTHDEAVVLNENFQTLRRYLDQ